jgi:ADP-L-glycero-D-manno-heptose 6-epimerase
LAKRRSNQPNAPRAKRTPSKRYIVTGGAGFIGSNLVAELIRRDPRCSVIVVDDFSSGSWENITESCARRGVTFTGQVVAQAAGDWLYGALSDPRPDAFFHLGACTDTTVADQVRMLECNAGPWWEGLMRSCETDGVPLVYASSAATYGTPPHASRREPFPLEAAGNPSNVYGFSKWVMESMHRAFEGVCVHGGSPAPWIVGLRYFNVFGPGESRKGKMASMAYQLATQALSGKRPRLFVDGEQARDQVSVDDVVDCTLVGAGLGPRRNKVTPGVYNLGSGRATTFNQVAAAVRKGLGLRKGELEVEYFDMPPAVRAFYQDFTLADMTRTRSGLNWQPRHDPVRAIEKYAAWMKSLAK